jgi:ABC-2 type transport system ATP-binding protein
MDEMTLNISTAVVRADGLSRRYGATRALDGVDIALERGITGLLGPNGAGKTTLLSILATVNEPDAGRVSAFGLDPGQAAERVEIRRRLGYLPQELGYHRHFTVAAFLDYVAILKEITDRRRRAEEVARVLAAVSLEDRARSRIRALSGGMRQRLGIAQALLGAPRILMLDEPTNGLDPQGMREVRTLLRRLADDGVTVFVSSHLLSEVEAMCDRVGVLARGRLVAEGPPGALRKGTGRLRIEVDDRPRAERVLAGLAGVTLDGDGTVQLRVRLTPPATAPAVNAALVSAGVEVAALVPEHESLEDVFVSLVEGGETPR